MGGVRLLVSLYVILSPLSCFVHALGASTCHYDIVLFIPLSMYFEVHHKDVYLFFGFLILPVHTKSIIRIIAFKVPFRGIF